MEQYLKAAIDNIAKYGDTDVLPYPIDNHIFFDRPNDVVTLLTSIHNNYDDFIFKYAPLVENTLATVGYTGFRLVTQIDPIWNAYLLALVLSIAPDIEKRRLAKNRDMVFSYRFQYDEAAGTLFDVNIGWTDFQSVSVSRAKEYPYVLICDIADFYPRIYHHRLENALKKATIQTETVRRIMDLLSRIANGVSYGLPVGGPAARILSEILLDRVDRILSTSGIVFCRYADDYHVFTTSREDAYAKLVLLSDKLLDNEGLSLQKAKTRILTREEFLLASEFNDRKEPLTPDEAVARNFLSLKIHYDPYSPTAVEDYEELQDQLKKFDIVGMLSREIHKSRIHQALTRRLISAIRHLESSVRNEAIRSLIANLSLLYPVFPNVMILIKEVLSDLDDEFKAYIFENIRTLIQSESYMIKVPTNLGYAVRVLSDDMSEETETIFDQIYKSSTSMMIKRDVILAMAKRDSDYWISDIRHRYSSLPAWERRSLIIASYILEDEGRHWRDRIKRELSPIDELYRAWAGDRKGSRAWSVPL